MISLISRWPLADGCPDDLVQALKALAEDVCAHEPDTLVYTVHVRAPDPLDPRHRPIHPPPPPIAPSRQPEVVFFEVYRDADAFARHVTGPIFTRFRIDYLHYFVEDGSNPGWPRTETPFLERLAGFVHR